MWQRSKLRTDEEQGLEQNVTWLELFYDLVFVVVIAELTHTLSEDINLVSLGTFTFLFAPIWWVWIVDRSRSMPCHLPDEQMARIVQSISLPESWMDRLLARIQLADEVKRVDREQKETEQRLKRLGQVYLDNLTTPEEYRRQKRLLEDRIQTLVVPGVDAVEAAGKLLERLSHLWEEADLTERRNILVTMLDGVYVDTVEEKAVVALRPKPAFQALFQIATTREGSGVVLYNEKPPDQFPSPEDDSPCSWWRRGRVELPVQKAP